MTEHLFDRFLGPYPRMYVTGSSVTQQQAMEIIRRTDQLFESLSTNDYAYLQRIARKLRLPLLEDFERDNLDEQAYRAARERWNEAHQHWLERWGYISTEYVINDWISSRSARGPRGWCHPDGTIGFLDPVGKG